MILPHEQGRRLVYRWWYGAPRFMAGSSEREIAFDSFAYVEFREKLESDACTEQAGKNRFLGALDSRIFLLLVRPLVEIPM